MPGGPPRRELARDVHVTARDDPPRISGATLGSVRAHLRHAWLVLVLGGIASVAVWTFANHRLERDARVAFDEVVRDAGNTLERRIRGFYEILYSLRGLFGSSSRVTPEAFMRFVDSVELERRYPGFRTFTYSEHVPHQMREEFEARMRREVDPGFAIAPPGVRPEYQVVTHFVGARPEVRSVLGLDIGAGDARRAGLERARDTGLPIASERIVLASSGERGELGMALRLAVYKSGGSGSTVQQRRESFVGVVGTAFVLHDLMRRAIDMPVMQEVRLRVFDTGYLGRAYDAGGVRELLFDSAAAVQGAAATAKQSSDDAVYLSVLPIDVGGRRWELQFEGERKHFLSPTSLWLPWLMLAGGLVTTLLLYVWMRALAGSNTRALKLADDITRDLRRSEAELLEAHRRTQELIEALPNPIYFKGTDGRYLGVNKAWEAFFGVPREEFIGKTVYDLYPNDPAIADRLHAMDQELWSRLGEQEYEAEITTPDGRRHNTIYYKATYANRDGSVEGLIGTIVDITERKRTERLHTLQYAMTRVLAEAETSEEAMPQLLQTVCEHLDFVCGARWLYDGKDLVLRCQETWGVDEAPVQGFIAQIKPASVALDSDLPGFVRRAYTSGEAVWIEDAASDRNFTRRDWTAQAGLHCALAFPILVGSDMMGVMEFFGNEVRERDERLLDLAQALGSQVGQFMTRKEAEKALKFVASHDALTEIPNRMVFHQRLEQALAQSRRQNRALGLMFIDLDRFKVINDLLGHDAGDELLREVAQRLRASLRASDTVARFGGDEFVVLAEGLPDPVHVGVIARKLLQAIAAPMTLAEREVNVTASIGVCTFPEDGADAATLLKNADLAMYRAKEQGKNTFQYYSAQLAGLSADRLALESGLRRAIESGQLMLHYQPAFDLASGRLSGAEALVRWQHPELGLVAPARFVPIAEESGLIEDMGKWVLKTVCAQLRAWRDQGLALPRVSINISPRQFIRSDLARAIERQTREAGLDPRVLEIEVTEGTVMKEPERMAEILARIKAMGVSVAIDDFGTGYSSLAYLKRFPIDRLKVDRSFISGLPADSEDAAITRSIIAMAHSLRLKVIAEGVETEAQLEFLREHGCDEMQGYLRGRPMPVEQFTVLLQEQTPSDRIDADKTRAVLRGVEKRS